ncbi:MAG: DUF3368 domain-containing protein [Cyanobacteria bacterium P01_F01_bin.150]
MLILDDREARQVATERGLAITGLLGLLDRAAYLELIDMVGAIEKLEKTTFRVSKRLLASLLAKCSS